MRSTERTQRVFSLFLTLCILSLRLWFGVAQPQNTTLIPVNVGVVLDMNQWMGKMGLSCISMALSDFYASHDDYKTRLVLNTRDSKDDVVGAAAAALDLLRNVEVQAILGPGTSMQADFVIDLGNKSRVPIISFSATSPFLSSIRSPYFVRATQNDSSQVRTIRAIVEAFGWREVVPICVDNEFGEGIMSFLADALQEINTRIPYRSVIPPSATDDQIVAQLYKLMTMQTRVFVLHMFPSLASRLFIKAKEVGMMSEGYVWIMTDAVTNSLSSLDPSVIDSMQGVLGVKPYIPRTKQLQNFSIRWKTKFQQENPSILNVELDVFGLWAYDAATALAMAVESVGITNSGFQKANISGNSTDLETFGVSQNGLKLLQALRKTSFAGLSGDFHIIDGQLQSPAYQIVNVIGTGRKRVGLWTMKNGIVRELNATTTKAPYSTSKANLGSIIWPGDTMSPPKGWVIPTTGKKLKIGVPMKDGFSEFVKVTPNSDTNKTIVTGYCIDLFDAIMATLPYAVPYEYVPFSTPDGKPAGTYNDLVYQVFLKNFDAVVGDTTIIANRSQYVDFTLPYTESGVSMIVPIRDNKSKNAWVFLRPLTWDLWVTSFFSFVWIGFVVWVLEHRINEDFRGPPSHQTGMIFWFSFSTMVFAHKEKVVSNLARFVVIIWCFVVLILTQSYTASLTSMLTVQQLQPTVTDVHELIKKGEFVGYLEGSFVLGLLKQLNFDESKLKVYASPEECDDLFTKGSGNGGIAAAFDEIPYIKLFLSKHCSKYTMVAPTYKTDGFGFVFPINSPLVHDVSRAVLNVTEGDKMVEIERAWFGQTNCPDTSTYISSNSLGLDSFWGLFLIAGAASFSALIFFLVVFIHRHKHIFRNLEPKNTIWQKIEALVLRFDKKDLSSHTFRKIELRDKSGADVADSMGARDQDQASPTANGLPSPSTFSLHTERNANCPPSPSSFSNYTDGTFVSFEGTPTHDYGDPISHVQTTQEMVTVIELANLNNQSLATPESTNENH
ncbi:glutamate receptor 2.3-like [Actinidia eriantha]|uniref:glutamate receptor 2.3-like n=1 Tax=Actinidia eriantha TaxID=165200 RepID=UPI002586D7AA|nr:glutamate receptor 2.3-like [Actinidia eriantha]